MPHEDEVNLRLLALNASFAFCSDAATEATGVVLLVQKSLGLVKFSRMH